MAKVMALLAVKTLKWETPWFECMIRMHVTLSEFYSVTSYY